MIGAAAMLSDNQTKYLLIGGGVLLVAGVVYLHWQAGRAVEAVTSGAKAVGNAVNPVSSENIFYQGVSEVTQAVTGNSQDSFGTWLYGYLNEGER